MTAARLWQLCGPDGQPVDGRRCWRVEGVPGLLLARPPGKRRWRFRLRPAASPEQQQPWCHDPLLHERFPSRRAALAALEQRLQRRG